MDFMLWKSSAVAVLLKKFPAATTVKTSILLLFIFVLAAFISSCFIHTSTFLAQEQAPLIISSSDLKIQIPSRKVPEFPLNCTILNQTQTCPRNYPETFNPDPDSTRVCPEFFRWIHEDLRPWAKTGITRDMVERANKTATFRLAIVKGRAYLVRNRKSIQTRDVFTIWGILQLLRRYPGKLPDLELMFDTDDQPVVKSRDYRGPNSPAPPPLFRYCGDRWTLDIVFPDWSFWGWAEINIKPWESILKDIKVGNNRTRWMDREPFAYWKGNPFVAPTRQDLLNCNVSEQHDWNARIYIQDWIKEGEQGFKQSDLGNQCGHRYKIYIEGYAWSVSEKYILACDSMTLYVGPKYYDFFIRSMQPVHHYWPIRDNEKCKSIKFAVDWANSHKRKAQEIGRAASRFMQEELKMENVYDYMYHLVNEYAKLLSYEVRIPEGGVEVCAETMACNAAAAEGREKLFMMESLVKSPSTQSPCSLAPPFQPHVLATLLRRKFASIHQVEKWEDKYWQSTNLNTTT